MNCKHCGRELYENAKFCRHCGKPVEAKETLPNKPSEPTSPKQTPLEQSDFSPPETFKPTPPKEPLRQHLRESSIPNESKPYNPPKPTMPEKPPHQYGANPNMSKSIPEQDVYKPIKPEPPVRRENNEYFMPEVHMSPAAPKPFIPEVKPTPPPKKTKNLSLGITLGILAVVAISAVLFFALTRDASGNYIKLVKNSQLDSYTTTTYGKAFESFFSNPEWTYKKNSEEKDVVKFTGGYLLGNEEATAVLEFIVNYPDRTFKTTAFKMNSITQDRPTTDAIISKVFEEYEATTMDYHALDPILIKKTPLKDTPPIKESASVLEVKPGGTSEGETFSTIAGYPPSYWIDYYIRERGPYTGINIWSLNESGIEFSYGMGMVGYTPIVDLRESSAVWSPNGRAEALYYFDNTYQLKINFLDDGSLYLLETGVSPFGVSLEGNYRSGSEINDYQSQYVFPDSDYYNLSPGDCTGLTAIECQIARNEIYARHGRMFKNEMLQSYFDTCSWYYGNILPDNFSDNVLNSVEKANITVISDFEKQMGYK